MQELDPLALASDPQAQAPGPLAQAPEPLAQAPNPLAQAPGPLAQAPDPLAQAPGPLAQAPDPARAPSLHTQALDQPATLRDLQLLAPDRQQKKKYRRRSKSQAIKVARCKGNWD